MGMIQLQADVAMNIEALPDEMDASVKQAFENLWAWNAALVEAMREEVVEELRLQGDAIDELIDQSENVLHPEMTAKIVGLFELGKLICQEFDKMLKGESVDDVTRKRLMTLTDQYRKAANLLTIEVTEITVDLDDIVEQEAAAEGGDEPDDDDGDDDGDGDDEPKPDDESDEADADDDDQTPVEIPQDDAAEN